MSRYWSLPDLIEDIRHAVIQHRHYATREELETVKGTPRALVNMTAREAEDTGADDRDMNEVQLARHLVGQFEEALPLLLSMVQD